MATSKTNSVYEPVIYPNLFYSTKTATPHIAYTYLRLLTIDPPSAQLRGTELAGWYR